MPATAAKPGTPAAQQPPPVEKPKHKLPELTTYELRGYRHQLEHAIAFFDMQQPVPAVRADLQTRLDAVLAEQDDRVQLADA
jgi:hypothetical protein